MCGEGARTYVVHGALPVHFCLEFLLGHKPPPPWNTQHMTPEPQAHCNSYT